MTFIAQMPEKFIRCSHDVLNLGTGTRLQQRQGVDQDGLIGDQLGGLLEFSQRSPRFDALPKHHPGLNVGLRRQ